MKDFEHKRPSTERNPASFEMMKVPEVVSEIEWGAQLYSVLLWNVNGRGVLRDENLGRGFSEYFDRESVGKDAADALERMYQSGADEESLRTLSFAYSRPRRLDEAIRFIGTHKPDVSDPMALAADFLDLIRRFDDFFAGSPEAETLRQSLERDRSVRKRDAEDTKRRLARLIGYFRPDVRTSSIRTVNFVPTDPFARKDTGSASLFGDELVIASHGENIHNQDHEFLHGIINPIVDKLSSRLGDDEKTSISRLANPALKNDYGEGWYSLLCEELIRTFKEVVELGGEGNLDLDGFVKAVSLIGEEEFSRSLSQESGLREQCAEMGIATIEDLRSRAVEYFDRFVRPKTSPLRGRITRLYREYSELRDEVTNFESFILERLPNLLNSL
ncbi:MAG: hypothetical protein HGB18_03790 [Candidatus Moranbacteria bacterium]|nr:hypothetical protein [Candidatus Moranbacteria bacterium]